MFPSAEAVAVGRAAIARLVTTRKRKLSEVPALAQQGEDPVEQEIDRNFVDVLLASGSEQSERRVVEGIGRAAFAFLKCAAFDSFLDGKPFPDGSVRFNFELHERKTCEHVRAFLREHEAWMRGNALVVRLRETVRGAIGMTVREEPPGTPQPDSCNGSEAEDEDDEEKGCGGEGRACVTLSIDTRCETDLRGGKGQSARQIRKRTVHVRGAKCVELVAAAMFACNVYEIAKICAAARHMDLAEHSQAKTLQDAVLELVADEGNNYFFDVHSVYMSHRALLDAHSECELF